MACISVFRTEHQSGLLAGAEAGDDSNAVYVPQGFLLWIVGNTLLAQSFNVKTLELLGQPFASRKTPAAPPQGKRPSRFLCPARRWLTPAQGYNSYAVDLV